MDGGGGCGSTDVGNRDTMTNRDGQPRHMTTTHAHICIYIYRINYESDFNVSN